jgi:predicted ATPase
MKIQELRVRGFRSLHDVAWQPGDLNIVIGPNASGKSNLLRVLELLSISAQGGLGKHIQREGGIEPLLWNGSVDSIHLELQFRQPDRGAHPALRAALSRWEYRLELVRIGKTSAYRVQTEVLGDFQRVVTGEKPEPFKLLERQQQRAVVYDENEHQLVAPEDLVLPEETLLSMAAGPYTGNRQIPIYQQHLATWGIYQDFHTDRDALIRQSAVARNETRLAADGQDLVSVLHTLYQTNREFNQEVNAAMKAAFGDEFEELIFPPAAEQRIQFGVRWRSLRQGQSAADLSDGTLRFLFLLAVLANPVPPPLIAIDEPETGLHPSMLPIIAEYSADASARAQIIFTTHSPAFLDAFKDIRPQPTITVLDWVSGKSELRIRSGSELEHWLQHYTLGEMYRSGELEARE